MTTSRAKILSVNVGTPKEFEYKGRTAMSAIWKEPVTGRISARGVNLEGDDQADRAAHGGYDKAIYAYSMEDIAWWEQQVDRTVMYGEFGENLTTQGIGVNDALVGERWEIGSTVLEISEPRIPCWRLGVRMNDKTFPRQFTQALRPGSYLRIITEGDIGAGDKINVISKPDHNLSVRDVFRIYTHDREEAGRILEVEQMSDDWKRWANDERHKAATRATKEVAGPGCC
ncbi:MAG: MOSC domain-containing protein [Gammaproteobacteria bacterium]